MEHSGSRDSAYSHTFTAISAQLAYRPERTTPRPHIDGTLPARVTAAENCTYAYIDDMGRYRVKLPLIWTNGVLVGKAVPSDWPNPMPVPNTASTSPYTKAPK